MRCPICRTGRTFHTDCADAALQWHAAASYDIDAVASVVRRLATICYLCGNAPVENAEHVIPRTRGGSDRWSNMGGACLDCNMDKRAQLLTLTHDQQARLNQHRSAFHAAHQRVSAADLARVLLERVRLPSWEHITPDLDEITDAFVDQLGTHTDATYVVTNRGDHIMIEFSDAGTSIPIFPDQ